MATLAEALALLDVVAGRKTLQRPPAATRSREAVEFLNVSSPDRRVAANRYG
jgi:hypothetical protein